MIPNNSNDCREYVAIPPRNGGQINRDLRDHLKWLRVSQMGVGNCFRWPEQKQIYRAAKVMGVTITTRKRDDGKGWDVWRIK